MANLSMAFPIMPGIADFHIEGGEQNNDHFWPSLVTPTTPSLAAEVSPSKPVTGRLHLFYLVPFIGGLCWIVAGMVSPKAHSPLLS